MESKRMTSLFEKLYDGNPWIDISISRVLRNISAESAQKKVSPTSNSIWEITNHMIRWREDVLQRVQGKTMITPNNNYFELVSDTSDEAWTKTLERFDITQSAWLTFLTHANEPQFATIYPNNNMTYYEHIHGILQHDCYHLGQIVILQKLI